MNYYYLHPFKPQYFFPKGFTDHNFFLSFFQPYSKVGAISWWLFRNIHLYRNLFVKGDIERYIPEKNIRRIIGNSPLLAFNKGTPGPEQKITALGMDNGDSFFIKYANSNLAKENVINEHEILKQLSNVEFVPKLLGFYNSDSKVLLKTSVLNGQRLGSTLLDDSIMKCLRSIARLQVKTWKQFETKLQTSFAHGDFCPWNMMRYKGQIYIYDWEMAGTYPLGYDLFTFLFQASFLLQPKKTVQTIIVENQLVIDNYFRCFNISNWKQYLAEFSRIKIIIEKQKVDKGLLACFQRLHNYDKKA